MGCAAVWAVWRGARASTRARDPTHHTPKTTTHHLYTTNFCGGLTQFIHGALQENIRIPEHI